MLWIRLVDPIEETGPKSDHVDNCDEVELLSCNIGTCDVLDRMVLAVPGFAP